MLWENLLDGGREADTAEVVDAWGAFVDGLVTDPLEAGEKATAATMRSQLVSIRDHGWFELADSDVAPFEVYVGAVARLHRQRFQLAAPMLEVWSALRVLASLGTAEAAELRAEVSAGRRTCVLAVGSVFTPGASGWVPFGRDVTVLLAVEGEQGVEVRRIDPGTGDYRDVNSTDPTLPSVAVDSRGELVGTVTTEALDRLRAELLVVQAAALSGQAEAMLIDTAAYLSTREQFGVPIGSFQALRHRAADLAAEVYAAHRLSLHTAERLPGHSDPLVLGLLAKSFVGSAALRMASEAVQLHGGMGFTWEGGVHFGLKRIMHLAMTGPTVGECEEQLGAWATEAKNLLWAGGLDEAAAPTDTEVSV